MDTTCTELTVFLYSTRNSTNNMLSYFGLGNLMQERVLLTKKYLHSLDLVDAIARRLEFNYTINIVADGNYGSYNKQNNTWNGMIGELLSQVC